MKNESIAIVGMGTLFPGSHTPDEFWNNSLNAKCFIREIPEEFWKIEDFYDPDPLASDKTYSKMAGIIDPVEFNPMEFGIPPKQMQSICVEQLYGLILARQALIDAGLYGTNAKKFDNKRTGVIMSASVGKNSYQLNARVNAGLIADFFRNMNVPEKIIEAAIKNYKEGIIEWDESSNPGYLANVVAGRIANRFNLKGTTCNVDAACASSLGAVKFACQELLMGDCDIMLAGGISLDLSNTTFVSFCKTPALSKSDKIRPFSANADGMLLGDGAGAVVLKRLSTAERDGDRIYALIEGIGSSSDGREKSIFSPSKEGEMLAISRSMEKADVKAKQIGMIEAHGTGTIVGDTCEVASMSEIFKDVPKGERSVVIGGCKGQTGHMRLAAGIASLIRASLAIYHKQFLPSVGCDEINNELKKSIFHVCQKPLPWIVNNKRPERYATINAFGFGGTNFNVMLKEYSEDHEEPYRKSRMPVGIILEASSKANLILELNNFKEIVKNNSNKLYSEEYTYRKLSKNSFRIGFAAANVTDAIKKVELAQKMIKKSEESAWTFNNIFYSSREPLGSENVVAMFPGQGAQYCEMFSDLTGAYPEMRKSLTLSDNVLLKKGKKPVSEIIYSKTCSEEEKEHFDSLIIKTQIAQSSLAAVEAGAYKVLKMRGFEAEHFLGHSFGELSALYAAGVFDEETLYDLAYSRGICMENSLSECDGTGMMALMCDIRRANELIDKTPSVYIANINSPSQIILSGENSALEKVKEKADLQNIKAKYLNVSGAFHSSYLKSAAQNFTTVLDKVKSTKIIKSVMSNYTGSEYRDNEDLKKNLMMQIFNPVRFVENVSNTYKKGGRIFVEIGPGKVLKGLVEKCLADKKDILVVSIDSEENEILQFESVLAALSVWGIDINQDKYAVKPNENLLVQKNKGTYSISPIQFIMPDVFEKMKTAKNKKADMSYLFEKKDNKCENTIKKINEKDKRMVLYMNKYDAMFQIQKLNATVVGDYLKAQDNQFEQLKELLNSDKLSNDSIRKCLFDYINCFQDNCLSVLKSYLSTNDMGDMGANDEGNVVVPEKNVYEEKIKEDTIISTSEIDEETEAEPQKKGVSLEEITNLVLKTISDITGYPLDMLECDMTLESDLGIDSIKRLELFSSINDELGNIFGKDDMAELAAVTSIEDSAEVIKEIMDDPNHEVWSESDIEAAKAMLIE